MTTRRMTGPKKRAAPNSTVRVAIYTRQSVTDDKEGAWLTLTTCNPKFSARQRLIINAELVSGPNLRYVNFLSRL